MRTVAVLALDGVLPYELGMPIEVFGRLELPGGARPYDVIPCGVRRTVRAGAIDIRLQRGLDVLRDAHLVMVPGVEDIDQPLPAAARAALRDAAARGAVIASICSGAFILAAAGLLDGRRATTHWRAAHLLAERYPTITVDPDVLFVDEGQILTSAGAASGLDLCFHLIRRDLGNTAAADASRLAVAPLTREGGQAQFIAYADPSSDLAIEPLLSWLTANVHRPLTLPVIAEHAGMSVRTLIRQFRAQTGTTPLQWLQASRVRRAQSLLESTDLGVEDVARRVGFDSATTFRTRFARVLGTSPTAYRRAFSGVSAERGA